MRGLFSLYSWRLAVAAARARWSDCGRVRSSEPHNCRAARRSLDDLAADDGRGEGEDAFLRRLGQRLVRLRGRERQHRGPPQPGLHLGRRHRAHGGRSAVAARPRGRTACPSSRSPAPASPGSSTPTPTPTAPIASSCPRPRARRSSRSRRRSAPRRQCGSAGPKCAGNWLGGLVSTGTQLLGQPLHDHQPRAGQGRRHQPRGHGWRAVRALRDTLRRLATGRATVEACSGDLGRVAVLRPNGSVGVYSSAGKRLLSLTPTPREPRSRSAATTSSS